ncbi:tyrosine-type recombinase/integrase [Salipiger sp. 1_MG-2023]|nr:site-specific integrase [Salipiger sp. 1_MG-2023]MDO6587370.1 tyrosine-type recombinase/integrase [Salipiger sp. 1_MG-2023]
MPDITIGRLRGGFCVHWIDPSTGKRTRHQLAARSRKEAEAEGLRVYREKFAASRPRGGTIADLWQAYVEELGDKPTARTMGSTGKPILQHFGAYTPEQITKAMCVEYKRKRYEAGKSQNTVWTELGHLRSAMNFAVDVQAIDRAPKIWRPAKPQPEIRVLNRGEARALIDGAHDPHIRLALVLLLGTGARIGAVLDLEWSRVDFERGIINLRIEDEQTRKGRAIVPMNNATRPALLAAKEAALSDYVIEYGGRRVKSIRTGFVNAVERSGIGHITIHGLRHTAAVTMLSAGIPIGKVAQVLGHSNTRVTETTYARYLPSHMQDAVDVLDFASLKAARA